MTPKLAEFYDKITQNIALFKRIETVYNNAKTSKLTPIQQRLTWRYYSNFVRAGAKLDGAQKVRISEINQKLAGLYTKFSQNLLADEAKNLAAKCFGAARGSRHPRRSSGDRAHAPQ